MLSATLRTSPGVALRGVGGRTVSRARKNPGATFALARNHSLKTAAHARIPQVLCGPVGRSLWPARVAVGAMGPKGGARGKAALQLKVRRARGSAGESADASSRVRRYCCRGRDSNGRISTHDA